VLRDQGIETVFGLLGGSMLELYDAIHGGGKIAYVGARDERAAGHMADAWARVTGKPGVVLGAQAGPGVVNLVTAVAEAQLAYSPLVVIAGAISRGDLGKDTFQEIDQVALFAPVAKRSILVADPARLADMLRDAIRLAMSGRRGPVVLHVPRDIFAANVAPPVPGPVEIAQSGPPALQDIDRVISLLGEAQKPVIVAGGGLKWSGGAAALRVLAEKLEIPVVASTGHADVMPHGHPLFSGQGGPRGNTVASGLTRDADFLLVLGARLAFNSTFFSHDYISADAKIAQVDIEGSAIGRYFPVELGIQADARETAIALHDAVTKKSIAINRWADWRAAFQADTLKLQEERAAEAANDVQPIHPRRALAEIRNGLPEDAIVTLDTGNACLQAADRLAHYQTPGLITPLDFGLVGFGYAAALGAKAAAPDRPVVSIMGDGGFGYTMAEITSAVRNELAVVAIVLDNGAWGAEKAYQLEFFGGRLIGAEIDSPPYDEVARLCGALGFAVDKPGELGLALKEALAARRPAVIHVKIDPSAVNTLRKDLFAGKK
ncbi:MAG: thiamine pyrophosphate-binding protein, partial [Hyphomicrobiaceae bacterium]